MSDSKASNHPKNLFKANTSHQLRGDYSVINEDFSVEQPYEKYTEEEQQRWRFLYSRQLALLPGFAAQEFMDGLTALGAESKIPRIEDANEILARSTGWELVAVPGLIPDDVFFKSLANKKFPVSWWVRGPDELDYLVEPDIFHDFFGHVPLLSNPAFSEYMRQYGEGGPKALEFGAQKMLARLYWYVVEFGLIDTKDGLRAFGAGMLSSKDETLYSLQSPKPNRIKFDLERVLNTKYMVDEFQKTYFVVESFDQLFEISSQDFSPFYKTYQEESGIDADKVIDGDIEVEIPN